MQWRNDSTRYGAVAVTAHWVVAAAVLGLFVLGSWMVDLTYYHAWYQRGPDLHRSFGILLLMVMIARVAWRLTDSVPDPVQGHARIERVVARLAHGSLYLLLFVAMASGYLITTADGSSISVFGWFDVPSMTGDVDHLEDVAGGVHYWSTLGLVVLAGVHALGALKHHWVDRDETLRRMLGL
ncbi:cytochrome b561 [Marinobacter santoriniensis NKSG1]|uniref:Cytochrome b561 n=1 Tax=Marinobacter santoriniensis NKSG1 TaxID=1288826 RepID=M7CV49_9GAMM|nr:cytochrome b [Marinobacter santoriniensis]EMP56075.1 cytochrome b561 [Marinobacter santoriniensis NKSG1]